MMPEPASPALDAQGALADLEDRLFVGNNFIALATFIGSDGSYEIWCADDLSAEALVEIARRLRETAATIEDEVKSMTAGSA